MRLFKIRCVIKREKKKPNTSLGASRAGFERPLDRARSGKSRAGWPTPQPAIDLKERRLFVDTLKAERLMNERWLTRDVRWKATISHTDVVWSECRNRIGHQPRIQTHRFEAQRTLFPSISKNKMIQLIRLTDCNQLISLSTIISSSFTCNWTWIAMKTPSIAWKCWLEMFSTHFFNYPQSSFAECSKIDILHSLLTHHAHTLSPIRSFSPGSFFLTNSQNHCCERPRTRFLWLTQLLDYRNTRSLKVVAGIFFF